MTEQHEMTPAHGAFLVGQRVYLRPLEAGDADVLYDWMNDPELRGLAAFAIPCTLDEAHAYVDRVGKAKDRAWFMICRREDNRPIGETGLLRIFHPWRTADVTMIIGDRDSRGKGLASEAMALLLDYAFGELSLHRLAIGVVGFNEAALAWWTKMGFRREGIQRDGYFYEHRYHDFVMMSLLEDEYREWRARGAASDDGD